MTKLDGIAALIVIDLQKGIVAMPTAHPSGQIVAHAAQLAQAFRKRGLPIVLVNVAGASPGRTDAGAPKFAFPADWMEIVPELQPQPGDCLITKHRWGAFIGTSLDNYLRQRGVTQVILAGVATSIGVESTARSAYDHGYNVVLVVDAMTDRDADAHSNSVARIFPRLGETANAAEVLELLNQRTDA
jgi:nicotinamidase-related amidase